MVAALWGALVCTGLALGFGGFGKSKLHPDFGDLDKLVATPALRLPRLPLRGGGPGLPVAGLGFKDEVQRDKETVGNATLAFLLLGGRLLDVGFKHVDAVGEAISQAAARGIPREEVWVTMKVDPLSWGLKKAPAFVEEQMRHLTLAYVDLVLLMHAGPGPENKKIVMQYPCAKDKDPARCRKDSWKGLATLKEQKKIRHLGVSNFGARQITELEKLGVAPVEVNQLDFKTGSPEIGWKTLEFCHQRRIAVMAYGQFCGGTCVERKSQDPLVLPISRSLQKTPAQVFLRWAIEKNVSVIPATHNLSHMKDNLDIFNFTLSDEQVETLTEVSDRNYNDDYVTPDAVP